MTELVVQRITKLTVQIILPILSHRSDNFFGSAKKKNKQTKVCFLLLLKAYLSNSIPQEKLQDEIIKIVIKQEELHKWQA